MNIKQAIASYNEYLNNLYYVTTLKVENHKTTKEEKDFIDDLNNIQYDDTKMTQDEIDLENFLEEEFWKN